MAGEKLDEAVPDHPEPPVRGRPMSTRDLIDFLNSLNEETVIDGDGVERTILGPYMYIDPETKALNPTAHEQADEDFI